jgi:hypothetical protein
VSAQSESAAASNCEPRSPRVKAGIGTCYLAFAARKTDMRVATLSRGAVSTVKGNEQIALAMYASNQKTLMRNAHETARLSKRRVAKVDQQLDVPPKRGFRQEIISSPHPLATARLPLNCDFIQTCADECSLADTTRTSACWAIIHWAIIH